MASAGDGAAEHRAIARERNGKADAAHRHRDHGRQDGEPQVVGDGKTGTVGKHRHEMRAPDAAAGDHAGRHDPDAPFDGVGGAGARNQAHRGETREKTKDAGEHDQTQIVLFKYAAKHAEHERSGLAKCQNSQTSRRASVNARLTEDFDGYIDVGQVREQPISLRSATQLRGLPASQTCLMTTFFGNLLSRASEKRTDGEWIAARPRRRR